jgi:16S rRNA (uracil1498-N3)-methyltransferase
VGIHRIYIEAAEELTPGVLIISGEEAHHAIRVKRLEAGDRVEVLNGRGRLAAATISGTDKGREGWVLRLEVEEVRLHAAPMPRIEVYCPPPKGPRLSELIDGLSQVGAALWAPLSTAFSVGESRDSKMDRTRRIAAESSKQCGRPWLMEVSGAMTLKQALASQPGRALVIADATGEPYRRSGAETIRMLIGPEGGWREDELAAANGAGARVARFGPYTMRVETAAVAAAAIVYDIEGRG